MKKVFVFGFWAVVGSQLFSSCAPSAHVEKDPAVNLKSVKTFAWSPNHNFESNNHLDNDIVRANVQKEINSDLAQIGWQTATDKPDVILDYSVELQRVSRRNYSSPYYSAPLTSIITRRGIIYSSPYYYPSGGSYAYTEKEATLKINMYRPNDNKLIWQASVEDDINRNILTEKDIRRFTKAAVKKLDTPSL